jgi:hypothetical protein
MPVQSACAAIDKGCRLELYFARHSLVVEPHAVGYDADRRPALLGWACSDTVEGSSGRWVFLHLDTAREADISGYLSQAPRPGFVRDDPRFSRILRQV